MTVTSEEAFGRSLEELNALCERAGAHKRRQLAERGVGTDTQRNLFVYHRTPSVKYMAPNQDGWVHLSTLVNELERERYAIWWRPSDDRIRLNASQEASSYPSGRDSR